MKIKFLLLITIILFSSVYAHGGSHDHKRAKPEGCIIYGTVLDSINSQPIEYVSISVINNNKDIENNYKLPSIGPVILFDLPLGELLTTFTTL